VRSSNNSGTLGCSYGRILAFFQAFETIQKKVAAAIEGMSRIEQLLSSKVVLMTTHIETPTSPVSWNKGCMVGQKAPLRLREI
jgi:uncharacterized protein YunC (DUF1805 family)